MYEPTHRNFRGSSVVREGPCRSRGKGVTQTIGPGPDRSEYSGYLMATLGSTEKPGRRAKSPFSLARLVKSMRTGMRWTTLT